MMGSRVPWTMTRDIWRRIFSLAVISSELQPLNCSPQSPPCRRNRLPSAASPNCCLSRSISHEVTRGGSLANSWAASFNASASGVAGLMEGLAITPGINGPFGWL